MHAKTDRPELSPCLARLADQRDPRYREALAIVRAGHDMLRVRPSTELPGFQLCTSTELAQEAKYRSLRQAEAESRQAIVRGEKRHESHR